MSWLEQAAVSIWAYIWTQQPTFSHCPCQVVSPGHWARYQGLLWSKLMTVAIISQIFFSDNPRLMMFIVLKDSHITSLLLMQSNAMRDYLTNKSSHLADSSLPLSRDVPVSAELQRFFCRILSVIVITHQTSTAWTPGITKDQSLLFIQLTRVHLLGSKGKVSGGRPLGRHWWWGEPEKSLFIAGDCFDLGTKATSSLPRLNKWK